MINVALFKPDIPQNTAAIIRLCACFNINLHIIEPCVFNFNDSRFKRVVMDYKKMCKIKFHENFEEFVNHNSKSRIILMTTKAKKKYYEFPFRINDIILLGRESAGVTSVIHKKLKDKIRIPMNKKTRSLNVVTSTAIVLSEALRQNNFEKLC